MVLTVNSQPQLAFQSGIDFSSERKKSEAPPRNKLFDALQPRATGSSSEPPWSAARGRHVAI